MHCFRYYAAKFKPFDMEGVKNPTIDRCFLSAIKLYDRNAHSRTILAYLISNFVRQRADGTVDVTVVSMCIEMALKFSNVKLVKKLEDPVTWGEPLSSPPSIYMFNRQASENINRVSLEFGGYLYYPDIVDEQNLIDIIHCLVSVVQGMHISAIDNYMDKLLEYSLVDGDPQNIEIIKNGWAMVITMACNGGNLSTVNHVYRRLLKNEILFDILFDSISHNLLRMEYLVPTSYIPKLMMIHRRKAIKCTQWVRHQLKVYRETVINVAVIREAIKTK